MRKPLGFSGTIHDRLPVILKYAAGGSVLDLGCVDARPCREPSRQRLSRHSLFRRLCQAHPDTLGVDIDAEGVEALRAMGYQVRREDVETMDLGRQFDTIVAGEIIEHVESPGAFLRNIRRHLTDRGVLLLSSPNPFHAGQGWRIWTRGYPRVHEGHVGWHDPITLAQLLRRTGLEPFEAYWYQPHSSWLKTWKRLLRPYFSSNFLILARPYREGAGDGLPLPPPKTP
ncbi:MAG: class I SAM-dependent methyltransferase [Phycisphaerae bacterium]